MKRMIRYTSSRFAHRLVDYTYPQLRPGRPRVSERETGLEEELEDLPRIEGRDASGG